MDINQSLKLYLDNPIDLNVQIKRKLDNLENDICIYLGRLQEIETIQDASIKTSVSFFRYRTNYYS